MKFTFSHKKNTEGDKPKKNISKKIDSWIVLLFVSTVLLVVIFVLSLLFFNKVSSDDYFKVTPEVTEGPEIISRDKLNKVLEYFAHREERTSEILSTPLSLPDPSVVD